MSTQRKFIRSSAARHGLFWGLIFGTILTVGLLTPARGVILTVLLWGVGGVVGLAVFLFIVIMLISAGSAVAYWLRYGYLTSPWSHSPWGKFYAEKEPYPHEY